MLVLNVCSMLHKCKNEYEWLHHEVERGGWCTSTLPCIINTQHHVGTLSKNTNTHKKHTHPHTRSVWKRVLLGVYFLACCLRKTPPISSRFRFARTCVPSCVRCCEVLYVLGIGVMVWQPQTTSTSGLVCRCNTHPQNNTHKTTYLALCDLECTLVLANLEQFHNALLVGCQANHLTHDLTHKLDTLGGTLCGVGMECAQ